MRILNLCNSKRLLSLPSKARKMPKRRLPIFRRVSNLLRISILIARMRKPVIPKLIFLKKARKLKRFKLLRHYNYRFLEEYEFSPSSTPLVHYRRTPKEFKNKDYRDSIYSILFLCRCLGGLQKAERRGGGEVLHCGMSSMEIAGPAATDASGEYWQPFDLGEEEDSVDQRAERFIQRFYEEMRLQRQESV